MISEIFCFNSARSDRNLTNLCSNTSTLNTGGKINFFLLPDRQMSFLKILDLPSAPENKLRDMVRFQLIKIYPGNTEDVSFDFIPFKTEKGWKIVLYILKKKYLNEVMGIKGFRGIVLPLQLLSKKELNSLSVLVIFYPGMVEIWKFVGGIPENVKRHDPRGFSVQNSLIKENKILNSEKLMTIYPYNKTPKHEMNKGRSKEFSETLDSHIKDAIYFPEYRVTKRDRITFPIVITAFIISLILLSLIALNYREFIREERNIHDWIEDVQTEADQNRGALEIIEKLENELMLIKGESAINIYNLLIRTSKAIDSNSDVLSFGLTGRELTLTLRSRSAVDDLGGIQNEFGNVRASNIRTVDDGLESYTVRVEIE